MSEVRDFDKEFADSDGVEGGRKYVYTFDYDVLHPFMLKSFLPFFRQGNLLELGSFKGEFTRRLLDHARDITCLSPATGRRG